MEMNIEDVEFLAKVLSELVGTTLFANDSINLVVEVSNPEHGWHIGTIKMSGIGDWYMVDLTGYGNDLNKG